MKLSLVRVEAPVGNVVVAVDAQGQVRAAEFSDSERRMRSRLAKRYGDVEFAEESTAETEAVKAKLERYFAGDLTAVEDLAVVTEGDELETQVWTALRKIPAGKTVSYGELAKSLGYDPRMARDIGSAIGANPVAVIVPCHRVIGKDGSLKGFAWGVHRKRKLLEHEGSLPPEAPKSTAPAQVQLDLAAL